MHAMIMQKCRNMFEGRTMKKENKQEAAPGQQADQNLTIIENIFMNVDRKNEKDEDGIGCGTGITFYIIRYVFMKLRIKQNTQNNSIRKYITRNIN